MEARYWEKGRCRLCPQNCVISESKSGFCHARKNISGKLISEVYGRPAAINVDPIEKKPLYHFLPGSQSFSLGTVGCNLTCEHCQNFDISCASPDTSTEVVPPEKIVEMALAKGCDSISYTYNEPTVFFEYAVDCAKLARKKGLKNVIVTNGFINTGPAKEFAEVMDAANVDLKAFNEDFYRKIAKGSLKPVLDTLKLYKDKLWLEVTNLIIDGKNDNLKEIEDMCCWLKDNIGNVPLHFSRAYPMHKMQDIRPTPEGTLLKARDIARKYLDYVYIGNAGMENNTICPKCGKTVIERTGYSVKVSDCCKTVPGVLHQHSS